MFVLAPHVADGAQLTQTLNPRLSVAVCRRLTSVHQCIVEPPAVGRSMPSIDVGPRMHRS